MILDKSLVKEIIKNNYSLGEIISINPLESGHESDNVKVETTKGDFVIKYFSQKAAIMREKIILQDLLFSKGVKLPQPIRTVTNDVLIDYGPSETIAIQSFIPGKAIVLRDEKPEKMFSLMSWFGKHLGEFHYLSKSITESEIKMRIEGKDFFDLTSGLNWIIEIYEKADILLPPHKKNQKILKEFEIFLNERDELFKNDLTVGILHSDLKPGDFFVENNSLTGILDFNGASYSHLMNELGTWIMYTSLYKRENKAAFQDFIKSYLENSKIPLQELKFLPIFFKRRAFVQYFYFAFRIYNNDTQGLGEEETNYQGFNDGINLIESSLAIHPNYFYDLALPVVGLEE
ncbi:MAG: phosphotransferase [Candidatus Heimdallarchaeota archaeon]|nr:phosphotransferase [Candidatus Heimdallarchaeota archaeon]